MKRLRSDGYSLDMPWVAFQIAMGRPGHVWEMLISTFQWSMNWMPCLFAPSSTSHFVCEPSALKTMNEWKKKTVYKRTQCTLGTSGFSCDNIVRKLPLSLGYTQSIHVHRNPRLSVRKSLPYTKWQASYWPIESTKDHDGFARDLKDCRSSGELCYLLQSSKPFPTPPKVQVVSSVNRTSADWDISGHNICPWICMGGLLAFPSWQRSFRAWSPQRAYWGISRPGPRV